MQFDFLGFLYNPNNLKRDSLWMDEWLDLPGPNHFGLTDEESETRRRGPGCGGRGG
jgi:hypothetical protein